MTSQNVLSRREQVIANRYLPPGIERNSKTSLFMLENTFSGTKLYPLPPLHFHGFQAKQKFHMFKFSRRLISKTTETTLPDKSISLKFCQNVFNRLKLKVTKFGGAR